MNLRGQNDIPSTGRDGCRANNLVNMDKEVLFKGRAVKNIRIPAVAVGMDGRHSLERLEREQLAG